MGVIIKLWTRKNKYKKLSFVDVNSDAVRTGLPLEELEQALQPK